MQIRLRAWSPEKVGKFVRSRRTRTAWPDPAAKRRSRPGSFATASRLNVLEHRVHQTRTQAERSVAASISDRGKRKHCARLLVTDDEVDDEHHGRSIVDSRNSGRA